jgi:hypothetical protein
MAAELPPTERETSQDFLAQSFSSRVQDIEGGWMLSQVERAL